MAREGSSHDRVNGRNVFKRRCAKRSFDSARQAHFLFDCLSRSRVCVSHFTVQFPHKLQSTFRRIHARLFTKTCSFLIGY